MPQSFTLFLTELREKMKVSLIVFHNGLVDEHVLNLARKLIALENEKGKQSEGVSLPPMSKLNSSFVTLKGVMEICGF